MRSSIKSAKRIVFKIGSSSLTHASTGGINYRNMELLVRILSDLKNQGNEIVLVTSGAQAVGRQVVTMDKEVEIGKKQALAAIGQAQLMMLYQRFFSEYSQSVAQVLLTKDVLKVDKSRTNAHTTFRELLSMGVIPIVNENDTISTDEIMFGDNDRLSAFVVALIDADLLVILSDIDHLYTDDPHKNKDAKPISFVDKLTKDHYDSAKSSSGSSIGTGGMATKISAARIVTSMGSDMLLMSSENLNKIYDALEGEDIGTFFKANKVDGFDIGDCL
jgi:glutamate 5-kinase